MVYLQSVGSFFDQDNLVIYPAFEDNTPDLDNGVSFTDDIIPGEWFESLDQKDLDILKNFLG